MDLQQSTQVTNFYNWINERHSIYVQRTEHPLDPPWTKDVILQSYKFTNVFRELDRTTKWMRKNWTNPNENKSYSEIIFNCCLFRMIGTIEFAEDHGWVSNHEWDPDYTINVIEDRLTENRRCFTGAYIITNQGLKAKKSQVVVNHFLKPVWKDRNKLAECTETNSLQELHKKFAEYKGWGGGGFMAYEVVTDLNHTPVLEKATDRYTWANAGPGAIRGLNRLLGRKLNKSISQKQANKEMHYLMNQKNTYCLKHVPLSEIDMRAIEHSLCEWDKYERVRLNQGRPRSKFNAINAKPLL
tara:strand:- start:7543 stop:8439 length:897 start_codon:yes stop_codon:yes gene_type:complete